VFQSGVNSATLTRNVKFWLPIWNGTDFEMLGCWFAFIKAVSLELPKTLPELMSAAYATAKLETRSKVCFIMFGDMILSICLKSMREFI
jgi:hypothetical protein